MPEPTNEELAAKCPYCQTSIATPALAFLHQQIHSEPYDTGFYGLRHIPFCTFSRIGELMESYADARLSALSQEVPIEVAGIYVASKTKHAAKWTALRAMGCPIISTWIDEAGVGESADLSDLWQRCISESQSAGVMVIYREPGEVLKGAWVELGAALASGTRIFAVGIEEFTIASDKRITHFKDLDSAIAAALAPYRPKEHTECPTTDEKK